MKQKRQPLTVFLWIIAAMFTVFILVSCAVQLCVTPEKGVALVVIPVGTALTNLCWMLLAAFTVGMLCHLLRQKQQKEQLETSQRLQSLLTNLEGGVISVRRDQSGAFQQVLYVSEGWCTLSGCSRKYLEEKLGGSPEKLIAPEQQELVRQSFLEQRAHGANYQLQYRLHCPDGRRPWVLDRGYVLVEPNGSTVNHSLLTDITTLQERSDELRMSNELFRMALKAGGGVVFGIDLQRKEIIRFDNAEAVLGTSGRLIAEEITPLLQIESAFAADGLADYFYHPDDRLVAMDAYQQTAGGMSPTFEARVRKGDGSYIWCRNDLSLIYDDNGMPSHMVGYITDIDQQKRQTDKLMQQAQSDPLTQLYNKISARSVIDDNLVCLEGRLHGLMVLDLDNFKAINDNLGHLFGDSVLLEVAAKLKKMFRGGDVLGRMGGDEFIIFMTDIKDREIASKKAAEICRSLSRGYTGEKGVYAITCSVGIAISEPQDTFESLFRKADTALYQAKSDGKNRFRFFDGEENVALAAPQLGAIEHVAIPLSVQERIFELLYSSVDFVSSVNMVLAMLGELYDVSRAYIMEVHQQTGVMTNIFEWCTDTVETTLQNSVRMCWREADERYDYFAAFSPEGVLTCSDTRQLPKPYDQLLSQGEMCATLQVIISNNGVDWGLVGFNEHRHNRIWVAEEVETLRYAARMLGIFLIKHRATRELEQTLTDRGSALDNLPSLIYITDTQGRVAYANRAMRNASPQAQTGAFCYQAFMEQPDFCPWCPARHCHSDRPVTVQIHQPSLQKDFLVTAARITWGGNNDMRLVCCQELLPSGAVSSLPTQPKS